MPLRGAVAPARMTSFFGRDREREQLHALLTERRLVTLLGPGGIGKTRLAAEVSADPTLGFDPVWWCGLAPLNDADAVIRALLGTVRNEAEPGRDPVEVLAEVIGSREALLVVDNCEHLAGTVAAVVEQLLAACPGLRVLATSREVLGVPGEHVLRLEGLGYDVPDAPARRLFVDRTEAAGGSAPRTRDEHDAVARICKRLDGVPLALEIVASRTRVLSLGELADLLDERFGLLDAGGPRGDARHRTLRATLDWSHDLLDDAQRVLFRRLGAFRCGGSLAIVEEVTADGDLDPAEVSGLLAELVDRSMVVPVTSGERTRFTLLEPLRAYAAERLDDAGEADRVADRHADAYAARCDRLHREFRTRWSAATLKHLADDDFPDIRAALAWCRQHDATPDRSFRILSALWHVPLLAHAEEIRQAALTALERWPEGADALRVDVVGVAALASLVVGAWDHAADLVERAHALEDATGVPALIARRAWLYYFVGHPPTTPVERPAPDARTASRRARDLGTLAREAGWTALACEAKALEARAVLEAGDRAGAEALARQALDEAERLGGDRLVARTLFHLGRVLDGDDARPYLERARAHGRATNDPDMEGHALQELAELATVRGDHEAAAALLAEALFVFAGSANTPHEWEVLESIVPVLRRRHADGLAGEVARWADRYCRQPFRLVEASDPQRLSTGTPGITAGERETLERLVPQVLEALSSTASAIDEPVVAPFEPPPEGPAFRRVGEVWELAFAGRTVNLPDLKGLGDLARLLARPGVEVHALELASVGAPVPARVGAAERPDSVEGDLGPIIDDEARAAYRERITALREEIDDAEATSDVGRAEKARDELDALTSALTSAYGLGGRPRRTGDPAERARTTVTSRIRATIGRIERVHPELGAHLRHAVRTGTFCAYDPETPVAWSLD